MAARRFYAYYIRGRQLALVEHDNVSGSGQTLGQPSLDDIGPSGAMSWKSPVASITDGLELEYTYSPRYRINDIEDKSTAITGYDESSGLLKFTGSGLSTDAAITYIVISGSEKWNGLHKINTLNANYWIVETKYNGAVVTESGITAYTDISVLQDETFELDISRYQANAVVYYLKAKMAEDAGDFDRQAYFMREFKRQLEKSTSALKRGPYMVQGFKEMR